MRFYKKIKLFFFLLFLAAIVAGVVGFIASKEEISVEGMRLFADSFGIWLPIAFIAVYAGVTIFFPTTPFMIIAGVIFGFKYGLIYTTMAGFISSFITFYISRLLGREFVDSLLSLRFLSKLEKWNEKIARRGITTVVVLRILPIMPFNVLNLLMGISKVSARDYAIGTLLGLAPSNVLSVYFGTLIVSLLR